MTCPNCRCPECRKAGLNAVLGKHVSRETSIDELNEAAIRQAIEQSAWRDTFLDPAADQLARDVVLEQERVG